MTNGDDIGVGGMFSHHGHRSPLFCVGVGWCKRKRSLTNCTADWWRSASLLSIHQHRRDMHRPTQRTVCRHNTPRPAHTYTSLALYLSSDTRPKSWHEFADKRGHSTPVQTGISRYRLTIERRYLHICSQRHGTICVQSRLTINLQYKIHNT